MSEMEMQATDSKDPLNMAVVNSEWSPSVLVGLSLAASNLRGAGGESALTGTRMLASGHDKIEGE